MKKTMIILATALVMAFAAQAQDGPRHHGFGPANQEHHSLDPQKMAEMQVNRLDKELNLTAEQKEAITELYVVEAKEMSQKMESMRGKRSEAKADRSQGHGPALEKRDEDRQKMEEHRKAFEARIESLLTPEQQTRYAKMREEQPMGGPGKNHHGKKGGHDCDKSMKSQDGKDCGKGCCDGDKKGAEK